MADFATEAELTLSVPSGEIRSARQTIEEGLGSVEVGLRSGGSASRARSDGGAAGSITSGRQGRRMFRWARERTSHLETVVELLGSMDEDGGGLLGGGGGGLLGGALGGAGLRRLAGGTAGAAGAGAVTGGLSVAASKVINLTRSTWPASAIVSIASSTWGAAKLISITAGTWAAGKLIGIGQSLVLGAAKLITVGSLTTVAAGSLIAVGSVLTLDALDIIDIGAALEADWDDVITLKGSVPFDLGEQFADQFPGAADFIHTGLTQNPIADAGGFVAEFLQGGRGPPQTQRPQDMDDAFRGQETATGGPVQVESNPTYDVTVADSGASSATNPQDALDELRRERDRELEDLKRELARQFGTRGPGP